MTDTARLRLVVLAVTLAAVLAASTCGGSPTDLEGSTLAQGTWGGDDAGAIVTETLLHVHFGCTNGDFPAPVVLDADGRFSVSGDYLVHAYPVAIGPTMPAVLAGVVRGKDLTMTVAVNDTTAHELVVFGPTTVRLGEEPRMQMCPICAMSEVAARQRPDNPYPPAPDRPLGP